MMHNGTQMIASLTWIDHDERERDRMRRILALFRERDTRDELGIGAIRDSFADHLFPGCPYQKCHPRQILCDSEGCDMISANGRVLKSAVVDFRLVAQVA